MAFVKLTYVLSKASLVRAFMLKFCQMCFLYLLRWSYSFCILLRCTTLIDWCLFNHPWWLWNDSNLIVVCDFFFDSVCYYLAENFCVYINQRCWPVTFYSVFGFCIRVMKEMGIPDHLTCLLRNLYAVQEEQLELEMEQHTSSKLGKEYVKAIYFTLLI